MTTITIPFSEACERNKDVILDTIKPYLQTVKNVLEIGSGTAQHALYFSEALPHLQWQTSDQVDYLDGIHAVLDNAKKIDKNSDNNKHDNVLPPFELNVNQQTWVNSGECYEAVYTANTLHIMTQSDVSQFFASLHTVTKVGSYLIVYGPFNYDGKFTSISNRDFDSSLRSRGVGSAIRDYEFVNDLANDQGFNLLQDHTMPANNRCLVWQRL